MQTGKGYRSDLFHVINNFIASAIYLAFSYISWVSVLEPNLFTFSLFLSLRYRRYKSQTSKIKIKLIRFVLPVCHNYTSIGFNTVGKVYAIGIHKEYYLHSFDLWPIIDKTMLYSFVCWLVFIDTSNSRFVIISFLSGWNTLQPLLQGQIFLQTFNEWNQPNVLYSNHEFLFNLNLLFPGISSSIVQAQAQYHVSSLLYHITGTPHGHTEWCGGLTKKILAGR